VSRAIGLTLTICGLVLGVWFVRIVMVPDPAPLPAFVVAAIAVAMISVGVRYILKNPKKKKQQGETSGP
jgi:hypothetical protein